MKDENPDGVLVGEETGGENFPLKIKKHRKKTPTEQA